MIQRVENTRIEDKENDDEDEIFKIDEKERKSNEDSAEEGNEASGERVNDYDPESISEKIGELRKSKDYNDELLLPKQATSSVEGEDREGQKKVVKKSIKKKTLSQVSVRRPDEPEAKSLADLGELHRLYVSSLFNKSNNFIYIFQTLKSQRNQEVFENKVKCFICIFFVDRK